MALGGLACTSVNPDYQAPTEAGGSVIGASSRGPGSADGLSGGRDTTATSTEGDATVGGSTVGDPTTDTDDVPQGCPALPPPEGTICHGVITLGLPQGCEARPVLVDRVDGDMHDDVVVGCNDGRVFVLRGAPEGLGGPQEVGGVESLPLDIAVADLDGVNGNDIIVVSDRPSDALHLFLRGDDGEFDHDTLDPGPEPSSVAVGRWFGGGLPDIAITIPSTNQVVVLRSTGAGNFAAPTGFPVAFDPQDVAMGHLDPGDAIDIVVASEMGNTVTLLVNDGTGLISYAVPFAEPMGARPNRVLLNDVELDGTTDILTTFGGINSMLSGIRVHRNGGGDIYTPEFGQHGERLRGLDDGNFDGNLYPDAVLADYEGEALIFLMLLDDQITVQSVTEPLEGRPWSVGAGLLDDDMVSDVVVSIEESGALVLLSTSP